MKPKPQTILRATFQFLKVWKLSASAPVCTSVRRTTVALCTACGKLSITQLMRPSRVSATQLMFDCTRIIRLRLLITVEVFPLMRCRGSDYRALRLSSRSCMLVENSVAVRMPHQVAFTVLAPLLSMLFLPEWMSRLIVVGRPGKCVSGVANLVNLTILASALQIPHSLPLPINLV